MERHAKFILGLILFLIVACVIGGYSYLKSREFIRGPQVTIDSPSDGSTFTEAPIILEGTAQNIAYISLNGVPIFVDSKGTFREKLLLLPGYNILTISAQDRFGKKVEKTLQLVYKESRQEVVPTPTSPSTL